MGKGFLSGYKTYIGGVAVIILAILAYTIDSEIAGQAVLDLPDLAKFIVGSYFAMTLRNGIANNK